MQVVFGEALESDPVDLAGGVQRDLVEEHDLLRGLVAHPRPGKLNQLSTRGHGLARLDRDVGPDVRRP